MKLFSALLACAFAFVACGAEIGGDAAQVAKGVQKVGTIRNPSIRESSGFAASRRFPGVFWTHNDGGSRQPMLYAVRRDGTSVAEFQVAGAALADWEDIAIDGSGRLFLADTGNNDQMRAEVAVHQIEEPDPQSTERSARIIQTWKLRFPKSPFDCEALFVLGTNGYVVSKVFNDARAGIYRFPLTEQKAAAVLEFVAETKIESPVTGADVSPDGSLIGIVAKSGAFVYRVNGDLTRVSGTKPHQTKFKHDSVEACAFVPEGLLATAESKEIFLFTNPAFRGEMK